MRSVCGACPISLICYTGNIYRMWLCPRCGLLEVTMIGEDRVRIHCASRTITKNIRREWLIEYDRVIMNPVIARIFIKEIGPPQKYYRRDAGQFVLPITFCDVCLERLIGDTKEEIIEELRKMCT